MNVHINRNPLILIVDDVPENLQVLSAFLDSAGFETAFATNGEEALEILQEMLPDLILLDISMPGMDGFEVCSIVRRSAATRDIPIIFLTAFHDNEKITRAFQVGAVDYVTKPFQQAELLARVSTHLSLRFAMIKMKEQNTRLTELIKEKNELIGIAAHDLKSPLQGIILSMENIQRLLKNGRYDNIATILERNQKAAVKMTQILKSWLDLNAAEEGIIVSSELIEIQKLLQEILASFEFHAAAKNIRLHYDCEESISLLYADRALVVTVLENLISNAIKFSPRDKSAYLRVRQTPDYIRIEIQDEGQGIAPHEMPLLFTKFAHLSAKPTGGEHSSGLGLAIVKKFVEAMNGSIRCQSDLGIGTTFIVELPI